ncbi:MAG: TatD family hydrolase, partial [Synergistales bacterium]|nr:TatD family hydrolase [Synergistales bacterium]
PVTFRKNDELREIVRKIPINRILCETDAPFLAPHPKRGTTNEPSYVKYVYEVIAQVKGITTEDLSKQVWLNSCELFGWE